MKEQKRTKKVLIDYATNLSRNELADFLEKIASKIRDEGSFTFVQNDQDVLVSFPENVKTEIEYEVQGDKHEFEIEVEWREGQKHGKMNII